MVDYFHLSVALSVCFISIVLSFVVTGFLPKKSYLPFNLTGTENLHKLILFVILIALFDFYLVSFFPIIGRIDELSFQLGILGLFFILAISIIFVTIEIRNVVLDLKVSIVNRNQQFLNYSLRMVLMQEFIVVIFYLFAIFSVLLDVNMLPGIDFIFEIKDSEIAELSELEGLSLILTLVLAGIKGSFLLLYHFGIILVFVTLFVIFEEWNSRTNETPVREFTFFTAGFVIQGMGQSIQSIGMFLSIFIRTSDNKMPTFINLPIVMGSFLILLGMILYFFFFMLASLALLNNISHLLLPLWMKQVSKAAAVIFPIIYCTLYVCIFSLSFVINFLGVNSVKLEDIADLIITMTHFIDIPALILMPISCGLFFIIAYKQGRGKKKGKDLSTFVLWTFLSLFLIFGVGNNTMSALSWFGMLHAPLALLGGILLLYGLSRVADHASRHRRVLKNIRENPDDFMFLTKLGEAERKISLAQKVDTMVKTGIIKPLVPTEEPPDETQVAAEINSYMAEISTTYKRVRKRKPLATS